MNRIAILGSTGSIGSQAVDVISRLGDRLRATVLTANRQADLLIRQARLLRPECVVIAQRELEDEVRQGLRGLPIRVLSGPEAICEAVQMDCVDTVLTALVGFAGLRPTLSAMEAGKTIALANKETMVVAGELVTRLRDRMGCRILPVDSEHSAIFQCLLGEQGNPPRRILLTASGGPFRKLTWEELRHVRKEDALRHPNWSMGRKITVDSASMMNKGFEVIEARWLFGVDYSQIEVYVHPESIVHSAVEFQDGTVKAQMGRPDMRIPIQLALTYPDRLDSGLERLDLFKAASLHFERPDMEKFRNLGLAYRAIDRGGNMPCILNAANEVAVEAFLEDRISFLGMSGLIERTMELTEHICVPTLEDYMATDRQARLRARELLSSGTF